MLHMTIDTIAEGKLKKIFKFFSETILGMKLKLGIYALQLRTLHTFCYLAHLSRRLMASFKYTNGLAYLRRPFVRGGGGALTYWLERRTPEGETQV